MKYMHISDLHLGKRVHEYSMLADQDYILKKILCVIDAEKPDGILIAGDIYDKSVPPAEAVQLFDDFLVGLAGRGLQVFVISGNHDSPERLAFGARLMDRSGIHLSPVYDGNIRPVAMRDSYGAINVYMLPFVKPAHVRRFFEEEEVGTYSDAVRAAVAQMKIDPSARNILVTHQFVTGALRAESEEISVGGSDNVDVSVFEAFDYVALGHIHRPQSCGRETVRYCGTPLKYSFSEAGDCKSATIVELREKGNVLVRTVNLTPKRDMREIRGSYEEITRKSFYENTSYREDYMHITLTDEEDIPQALGKLRVIYRNLMKLDYDNRRTREGREISGAENVENKSPLRLFADFYELQNNQPMSSGQEAYVRELIGKIWESEVKQ